MSRAWTWTGSWRLALTQRQKEEGVTRYQSRSVRVCCPLPELVPEQLALVLLHGAQDPLRLLLRHGRLIPLRPLDGPLDG
jgi:hypothetical protein